MGVPRRGEIDVMTAWARWSDADRLPVLADRCFAGVTRWQAVPVRGPRCDG